MPTPHEPFYTISQFCEAEPAFTAGGIRHLIFTLGAENIPGLYRFGRRILIDRTEFLQGVRAGACATIAGKEAA